MNLKIKKTTGEIFDLPPDYVIEAEKNNPLFTNKGSKTVPIHFPNTDNNRKLLLNSDRLDRLTRPDETFRVIIETGAVQQSGLLAINAPFNASIGLNESEMYNQMSAMKLKDIPDLPSFSAGGEQLEQKLDALLSHLTAVMKQQVEADYFVFPVFLEKQFPQGLGTESDVVLNQVEYKVSEGNLPFGRIGELLALNNRIIKRVINSEEVLLQAPRGYGVSPFIKVHKVLELIFKHFGLKIEENPFKTHRQLKKLVVLNNVMDAILTGELHYKDLMPDVTIREFLEGLYNKFGMQYFVHSTSGTVRLKFLKDTLLPSALGSVDLDPFKTEEPQISYTPPKQLKLVPNREIEGSGVKFPTYEAFLKAYKYQFTEQNAGSQYPVGWILVFDTVRSRYMFKDVITSENQVLSQDFFDWDKQHDLEYEEIKMDDLCLPLTPFAGYCYLSYLVSYRHLYSDVILSGDTQKEDENPAKLAFAFAWGLTNYTDPGKYNFFFASQFNRDENGNFIYDSSGEKYDISLICNREDGLFNRFWKAYDAFLRHSNFEVKCKLKLSEADLFGLEMFQSAILNHQPLLPKQIRYQLNQKDGISECTFQTIRLYEPYDLESEQNIPVYMPQRYYWDWVAVDLPDPANYPQHSIKEGMTNTAVYVDGVEYPTKNIVMMPPSEEEYLNQEKRIFKYEYTLKRLFYSDVLIKKTVTFSPKIIHY